MKTKTFEQAMKVYHTLPSYLRRKVENNAADNAAQFSDNPEKYNSVYTAWFINEVNSALGGC